MKRTNFILNGFLALAIVLVLHNVATTTTLQLLPLLRLSALLVLQT